MSIIRQGLTDTDLDVPTTTPSLLLNFSNSQELDPRISFTRGSTGTYVGPDGLIRIASANQPRFDYDPVTGECRGLLIEGSRTNTISHSENISNWTNTGVVITSNSTTSPRGSKDAFLITQNNSNNYHRISLFGITPAGSGTFKFSCYMKYNGQRYVAFMCNIVASLYGCFDLLAGAASVGSIRSVGNGWFYCISRDYVCSNLSANNTLTVSLTPTFSSDYATQGGGNQGLIYKGDGASGFYLWGVQSELGNYPTSYIPTSGSQVTRSADVATISGTNFSSFYNSSEGTIIADTRNPASNSTLFSINDGTNTNRIQAITGTNTRTAQIINTSTTQASSSLSYTYNKLNKFGLSYASNNMNLSNDGVLGASNGSVILPVVDRLRIGSDGSGSNYLNSAINSLTYYPRQLSNPQLQYITR